MSIRFEDEVVCWACGNKTWSSPCPHCGELIEMERKQVGDHKTQRKCGACRMIAEHGKAYSYLLCFCEVPIAAGGKR